MVSTRKNLVLACGRCPESPSAPCFRGALHPPSPPSPVSKPGRSREEKRELPTWGAREQPLLSNAPLSSLPLAWAAPSSPPPLLEDSAGRSVQQGGSLTTPAQDPFRPPCGTHARGWVGSARLLFSLSANKGFVCLQRVLGPELEVVRRCAQAKVFPTEPKTNVLWPGRLAKPFGMGHSSSEQKSQMPW